MKTLDLLNMNININQMLEQEKKKMYKLKKHEHVS